VSTFGIEVTVRASDLGLFSAAGDYVQLGRRPHIMSALVWQIFLVDNCAGAAENGGESSFQATVRHSAGHDSGSAVSSERLQQTYVVRPSVRLSVLQVVTAALLSPVSAYSSSRRRSHYDSIYQQQSRRSYVRLSFTCIYVQNSSLYTCYRRHSTTNTSKTAKII